MADVLPSLLVLDYHAGLWACASKVFACSSLDNCSKQNFTVGAYRAVMNAALSTDLFDSSATATSSITPSMSASTDAASASTCAFTEEASYGISTGAAAGIGVGIGLPLTIVIGALTFMLMREKKRWREAQTDYQQQQHHNQHPEYSNLHGNSNPALGKPEDQCAPTAEISGQTAAQELADTQRSQELTH